LTKKVEADGEVWTCAGKPMRILFELLSGPIVVKVEREVGIAVDHGVDSSLRVNRALPLNPLDEWGTGGPASKPEKMGCVPARARRDSPEPTACRASA
jgi:hypothetical protein